MARTSGIDAALEIAVAGKDGSGDQVALVDGQRDVLGQGPGIADAGGAAEADEVEAELVEIGLQPRLGEIVADHLAARRERGLHPGLGLQPALDGVPREQPGADHHARVGGVGAGGDRRDHHVAMTEVEGLAGDVDALGGLAVAVELGAERIEEARLRLREEDAVLRPLGAGERRLDRVEVERQRVGEDRVGRLGGRDRGPAPWHRPRPGRRGRARGRCRSR